MATYRLRITPHAARSIKKLPAGVRQRIGGAVEGLRAVQRPPGVEKLRGYQVRYRIRVGDYRVIYDIEDAIVTVVVIDAGHRREVYRDP